MKKFKLIFATAILIFISQQGISNHIKIEWQTVPWIAPTSVNTLLNPYKGIATATAAGKILYTKYCVVCHGTMGKGDGAASAALQIPPADHSSVKIQSQTDGAIYWKISTGHGAMAPYKNTLTEDQRWQLVNYIRTLAKK